MTHRDDNPELEEIEELEESAAELEELEGRALVYRARAGKELLEADELDDPERREHALRFGQLAALLAIATELRLARFELGDALEGVSEQLERANDLEEAERQRFEDRAAGRVQLSAASSLRTWLEELRMELQSHDARSDTVSAAELAGRIRRRLHKGDNPEGPSGT